MSSFKPETARITEIYDLVSLGSSAAVLPDPVQHPREQIAFVYGRKSAHLRAAVGEVAQVCSGVILCGKLGKDSGDLPFSRGVLSIPKYEEAYLYYGNDDLFSADGYVIKSGDVDPKSRGRQNGYPWTGLDGAQSGVRIIGEGLKDKDNKIKSDKASNIDLVTVQHPVQTMRLGGAFIQQAQLAGLAFNSVSHYVSKYPFNPENPFDQFEAANELTLIDTFSKGRNPMLNRPDLPEELVEYAHAVKGHLLAEFKAEGIRNPSTADDTVRGCSPIKMMLLTPRDAAEASKNRSGLRHKLHSYQMIGRRGLSLAESFARQQRTRLPL
ncbi:MAG TPA: hypothetical protein VFB59_02405 [Candidatus Saccharimonadales bacterium]|nr:hypothetical protein [Candidatus Saccharimonadales bacterium]